MQNVTEIDSEKPLRRGLKRKRICHIAILDLSKAISRKRCKVQP